MQVLYDPLGNEEPPRGAVLSIGNFDGVHLGHKAVLRLMVSRAVELGSISAVMTFDPHPLRILRPREAPQLISTPQQRLELMKREGIEVAMVLPFTHRLARMPAEDFVRRVLVERLEVREVYIGNNFRFGADRGGDVDLLATMGRQLGFQAAGFPTVAVDDEVVSSTRLRKDIAAGNVEQAWRLLGRPMFVDGEVFRGERLGRKLGFPTLNIAPENELFPRKGVYVTVVHIPSFSRTFPSVTNIGVRPTLYENYRTTVESHLLDFTADVYKETVRLFFLKRLRDEQVFQSTLQLVAQVRRDVEATRLWFLQHPVEGMELVHS